MHNKIKIVMNELMYSNLLKYTEFKKHFETGLSPNKNFKACCFHLLLNKVPRKHLKIKQLSPNT